MSYSVSQYPTGVDYSEPPKDEDRLGHLLARYAALLAANAAPWNSFVALATDDFPSPAPKERGIQRHSVDLELQTIFAGLVKRWHDATGGYSVTTRRYAHSSYQSILALKEDVVPLILREMQERPDCWFEALKALTGENPVAPNSSFEQATHSWIAWGQRNNKF